MSELAFDPERGAFLLDTKADRAIVISRLGDNIHIEIGDGQIVLTPEEAREMAKALAHYGTIAEKHEKKRK